MGRREFKKEIKKFLANLCKDFKIQKVILFGSRAYGDYNKDSDFDLLIVSKDFNGMDFFERVAKMYDYWSLDAPVDFLCYTPEEFNKLSKMITIVREAVNKGIVIK